MLKRSKRIAGRKRMQSILKKGRSSKGRFFVLKGLPNQENHNRFAIVISRKVEKSAVKRNYKRRQIYDILRPHSEETKEDAHFDLVILVRTAAMNLSYNELKTEIQSLPLHPSVFGKFFSTQRTES